MTDLHIGEVTRTDRVSPGMVRVTVSGPGMASFTSTGIADESVRIHFPEPSGRLNLPSIDSDGNWSYPEAVEAHVAPYTVRRHDPLLGEIDFEFVQHGHGRAAAWAASAQVGDRIAFGDARGLHTPHAGVRRQVYVTDATGLPALARLLEDRPEEVDALAAVEIADATHRLPLTRPAGRVQVQWIEGRGNGVAPSAITEVLREIPVGDHTHLWVAGESGALRDARRLLRHERGLSAEQYTLVGYWRHRCEEWLERYHAVDESALAALRAVWDEVDDEETARDLYEDGLERLGL